MTLNRLKKNKHRYHYCASQHEEEKSVQEMLKHMNTDNHSNFTITAAYLMLWRKMFHVGP